MTEAERIAEIRIGDLVRVNDDFADWFGIVFSVDKEAELCDVVPLDATGRACCHGEYDVSLWRVRVIARAAYDAEALLDAKNEVKE